MTQQQFVWVAFATLERQLKKAALLSKLRYLNRYNWAFLAQR